MKSLSSILHRTSAKPPFFMFKWLWSFTLLANVAEYFTEVADFSAALFAAETIGGTLDKNQKNLRAPWTKSRRLVRLLFLFLLLKLFHLLYLMFIPLDSFTRFLHFDFVHLFGCPQMTNILPVTVCAVILFSFYTLYRFDFKQVTYEQVRPMQRVAALIDKVYYKGDDTVFLYKNNVTGKGSEVDKNGNKRELNTTVESIRNGTKLYLFSIRYTNDFIVAHYVFFQAYLAVLFIMNGNFYFTSAKGVGSMVIILFSESTILLLINSAASIISTVFMINFVYSSILFKRFRQAEVLLEGSDGSTDKRNRGSFKMNNKVGGVNSRLPHLFNATLFGLFARHHTQTLLMVLYNNHAYGRCVTAFIVTFILSNSYLTQLIVKGDFNFQATIFLGNYVLLQWVLIVGFHLLAAKYCERIHCCAKPLMKASTTTTSAANSFLRRRGGVHGVHAGVQVQQPLQQSTTSIRYVTTLALYVEKFHTEHEYGMTYFDLGLISLKTFVKFLFIYCEIFLYVYQLKSS